MRDHIILILPALLTLSHPTSPPPHLPPSPPPHLPPPRTATVVRFATWWSRRCVPRPSASRTTKRPWHPTCCRSSRRPTSSRERVSREHGSREHAPREASSAAERDGADGTPPNHCRFGSTIPPNPEPTNRQPHSLTLIGHKGCTKEWTSFSPRRLLTHHVRRYGSITLHHLVSSTNNFIPSPLLSDLSDPHHCTTYDEHPPPPPGPHTHLAPCNTGATTRHEHTDPWRVA